MGFFDEWRKLAKPYADDEDDYEYEDEMVAEEGYEEEPEEAPARSSRRSAAPAYSSNSTSVDTHRSRSRGLSTAPQTQVVIVKPEQFENVAEIADHLRDKRAVLLNLEKTNKDAAKRLVDFLSGCAYALDGRIKKVATLTYLIVPYNVEIMGDLVEELESEGMYL